MAQAASQRAGALFPGGGLVQQGGAAGQCRGAVQFGLDVSRRRGRREEPGPGSGWYDKAARQGDADAQFWLGFSYENGEGVEQDPGRSLTWYRKAAEQGNATAQCALGRMYCNGEGVKQDPDQAIAWLSKAAQGGDPEAQTTLIEMYRNGIHTEPDFEKAIDWVLRRMAWVEPPDAILSMAGCQIDDAMFAAVMARLPDKAVPDEAVIREIHLQVNRIGDAGALELAGMIDRCTALSHLDLSHNPVGQPGLAALAQAMRSNTTMQEFIFDSPDKVDETMSAELERIAAECRKNGRIAGSLREQESWRVHGWSGFPPDLLQLLEQSLIRTDIKLHDSDTEDTQRRVLEMQLCLSGLSSH